MSDTLPNAETSADGMADEPASTGQVSLDDLLELWSSQRRRRVLDLLAEHGTLSFDDLVDEIAALENGREAWDVTRVERKRVYTALHQNHLPKLERQGVVTVDKRRRYRLTARGKRAADALATCRDQLADDVAMQQEGADR